MSLILHIFVSSLFVLAPQGRGAAQDVLARGGASEATASDATPPGPTQSFVAYNRFSIFGVDDQGSQWAHPNPLVASKINGAYPIQSSEHQLAYRFTLPAGFNSTRSVDALWLYYRTIGQPGLLSVALRESDPATGAPSGTGTLDVPFGPHEAGPAPGWHRIALPQSFDVVPGRVYHVLVRGLEDTLSPENRVDFVHLRSRMPVPFLPYDERDPGGSLRTPADPEFASMHTDARMCGWMHWQASVRNYVPIFLVEHDTDNDPTKASDPMYFGQPYDSHLEHEVSDTDTFGQAFAVEEGAGFTINHVSLFTRGAGQPGLPNCQGSPSPCNDRPCGDLLLEVYQSGKETALFSQVLIDGQLSGGSNPIYRLRSHWFGAYLDSPLTLQGGKVYYFMLSSPKSGDPNTLDCHDSGGDGWDGWVYTAQSASLASAGITADDLPTYRGVDSWAVRATRLLGGGGPTALPAVASFIPLDGFRADAGFMLGNFPAQRPIAVYDEGTAQARVCDTFGNRALAGEPVRFHLGNRNLGQPAPHGTMFARILDGGQVLDTVYFNAIGHNEESSASTTGPLAFLDIEMPDLPAARFDLEMGWVDPTLPPDVQHVVDDRVPADIRRTPCCLCMDTSPVCPVPFNSQQKP